MTARETSARGLLINLVALLVLAGTSLGLRFADLGDAGFPVAMAIAAVKAVLVAVFFMEIAAEKPSIGLAFAAGVMFVAVLVVFVVADIVTRPVPPLADPPGTAPRTYGEVAAPGSSPARGPDVESRSDSQRGPTSVPGRTSGRTSTSSTVASRGTRTCRGSRTISP
jgi:cytochrome c oxidase subunit 4